MREALKTAALVLAVAQAGTSIHGDPTMFQRIFEADGVTVTGNFNLYNNYSRIRCGAACRQQGCLVWAWNQLTLVCQVYTSLEHTVTLTPAIESLQTFSIIMRDYFLLNCPEENAIDWNQARALCENQGATMTHIAEEEKLKLIMQRSGCDHVWIGLQMDFWTAVWYDMDNGTLTNAYWGVGEPEPLYTKASYRMPTYMGLVATFDIARNYAVLCKSHA